MPGARSVPRCRWHARRTRAADAASATGPIPWARLVKIEMLAMEADGPLTEPFENDGERLVVDGAVVGRIAAVKLELDRRGAAPEPDIEPAVAHLVEMQISSTIRSGW